MKLLYVYLIVINIISAFVTIFDKISAVKHKWRIREATLLILSVLGGSLAMYVTMLLIRHKTKHIKFMLGIPLIITIQFIAVFYIRSLIYG